MNQAIRWAAELTNVEEASVLGVADLGFWKEYLRSTDLVPSERQGKAQILIVAGAGKFAGIRFRELSFSVPVSRPGLLGRRDAAYLVQAINSCRFFAFFERAFFSTPYTYGDVRLAGSVPAALQLAQKGRIVFQMRMQNASSAGVREPTSCGEDGWEGTVFLPDRHGEKSGGSRMFFTRIRGYTKTYPFLPETDLCTIASSSCIPVLQALADSHFSAAEWILRQKATHAKSKTYGRAGAPDSMSP